MTMPTTTTTTAATTPTDTWDRVVVEVDGSSIGTDLLRGLIDGRHAIVVLKGLIPDDVLAGNRERVRTLFDHANTTQYVNGSLTIVGLYLIKYLSRLDDYFRDAQAAQELTDTVSFDLVAETRERLRRTFGLRSFEVATETDGRRYASSNVRIYPDGVDTPLHNDNIMRDGVGYGVRLAGLQHQLSCVVCMQECDDGGELSIYRKRWEQGDEPFKIPAGLGYDMGVVADVPVHHFKPQTGDVFLLNPTYYHAIERVVGTDRLTMGFFFGFFDDELTDGVAWV